MFYDVRKPIAIVMDDIDSMNSGDKGGINSLIKLVRAKKTKKQKVEAISNSPIICINNNYSDKKIKELMKVCMCIDLCDPTPSQIHTIIKEIIPNINNNLIPHLLKYINTDLRRVNTIIDLHKSNLLNEDVIHSITLTNSNTEDVKILTCDILNKNKPITEHNYIINETDRTIVGLLWHENIIDFLKKINYEDAKKIYLKILNNICFADYIDRITFQKQIWEFNEMSSLIKTFYNNKIYHNSFEILGESKFKYDDIRFTKVLTKYSTEYNNSTFIQFLCQELNLDKKDMFSFFIDFFIKEDPYDNIIENYNITKLDINRINKFVDVLSAS